MNRFLIRTIKRDRKKIENGENREQIEEYNRLIKKISMNMY